MLTSLAAVLVLLAVGFYTLSVGATGRAGAGEGTALSSRTRALVLLLSIASLGGAYVLYRKPLEPAPELDAIAATTPALPVSRGRNEAPRAEAAAEPIAAVPDAEKPDAADPVPTPVVEESLSSAALALEAENQTPKPVTVLEPEPVVERQVVAAPAIVSPEKPAVAPARSTKPVKPRQSRAAERSKSDKPVVLHVQNLLGPTQAREQLTLSIEGRPVAELAVDARRPGVEVAVPLPRGGLLRYRLEGVSDDGFTTTLVGEGCIRVQDEARFDVRRRPGSQKVFLEASAGPAG